MSLGSNLGDRVELLRRALQAIGRLPATRLVRLSSLYETRPWGLEDQPDFYNLVAELTTSLPPGDLLRHALAIETSLGRQRSVRWGPRTVDIDILLYGSLAVETPSLTLPHPRMLQRAFVLVPLAELEPGLPIHGRTVAEHLAALGDASSQVRRLGPLPGGIPGGGAGEPQGEGDICRHH